MKLIIKSDDYGFTKGVTEGILDGIRNGIINCTGIFMNMPESESALKRMEEFPDVCFGIDINIVSGKPVGDLRLLPHLVNMKTGEFIRSTERIKEAKEKGTDFWPYEECKAEAKAQIDKFIEMTGKKPAYINGHSVTNFSKNLQRALTDIAYEYQIPYVKEIEKLAHIKRVPSWGTRPFDLQNQYRCNTEDFVLSALQEMKDEDIVMISGHCGYVDDDLLKYSSYTVVRARDHKMYCSDKLKRWIKEHQVELITLTQAYEMYRSEA